LGTDTFGTVVFGTELVDVVGVDVLDVVLVGVDVLDVVLVGVEAITGAAFDNAACVFATAVLAALVTVEGTAVGVDASRVCV
jgi:hypothetical protein